MILQNISQFLHVYILLLYYFLYIHCDKVINYLLLNGYPHQRITIFEMVNIKKKQRA